MLTPLAHRTVHAALPEEWPSRRNLRRPRQLPRPEDAFLSPALDKLRDIFKSRFIPTSQASETLLVIAGNGPFPWAFLRE